MSNLNKQQLSENQKKAQQYLKDHRIEEILGDILNTIAHNKYEQPLVYMIKYLAKQLPNEVLTTNGISIQNQDEVDTIMQIQYPQFDQNCNNIFRQILSREVYQQCKSIQTEYKNNLRHLIQLALENQKHKVGLFACDSSCYTAFKPIFNLVQNSIFTKIYPLPESFEYERLLQLPKSTCLNQEFKYFEEFNIKIKRNVSGYQFNPVMKSTEREQVKSSIIDCIQSKLNRLFTQLYNLEDLQSEDRTNLAVQFNKLIKESNALLRSGLRYREWPDSRSIAISNNKKYLIQVNKEDHFELKCSGTKELNFLEYLVQSIQITQLLDKHLGFNFDSKEGFTTVKPIYQGLALKFKIKVKIPSSYQATFKTNIENLKKNPSSYIDIKSIKKDSNRWMITLNKTFGLTWNTLIQQIETSFQSLFQNITDKDQSPTQINIINLDQFTSDDIAEQEEEETDEIQQSEVQSQQNNNKEENGQQHKEEELQNQKQIKETQEQGKLIQKNGNMTNQKDQYNQAQLKESNINSNQSQKRNYSNHSSKSTDESVNHQNEIEEIHVTKEEPIQKKNNYQKNQIVTYIKKSDLITQNNENTTQNTHSVAKIQSESSNQNNEITKLDHIEITIEENTNDKEETKWQNEMKNDIQILPYDFDRILQYKRVERASNYSELQVEISKIILRKNKEELQASQNELYQIISESDTSVVLQSYSQPKEFIKESYFILRRNFKSIPLKSKMNDEEFQKVDQKLLQFIKQIENQYKGQLILAKEQNYEKQMNQLLKQYHLYEDNETFNQLKGFDNERFSYGSLLYKSENLKILGNLDDHLIIVLNITQDDIIESLVELYKIYNKLKEQVCRDDYFGYLTRNPKLCGSGLSIVYKIKEVKRSNIILSVTQTDENSNIITQYLEKDNCVQIELNRVDQTNLHQFAQDCNNHLAQIKLADSQDQLLTENQLTYLDCFDQHGFIVAPEKECYTFFKDAFERYIKKFNLNESPLELTYSPNLLMFNEINKDITIQYEIRRNFEQFNFTKYMTHKEVETLKQYFEKIFKNQDFHVKSQESNSYKTVTYMHNFKFFKVDVMKNDHLSIYSFGKLKSLQKSLAETFDLLQKLQNEKFTYLRDENLGYLSEQGQRLGDNFYIKIEMTVNQEELEIVQKLAKSHQYNLTVQNTKGQTYNNHIELELKRCGYFRYEMEFIIILINALSEKKEHKKQ
ncbi:ATP:guanido phosphotransferase, carboxy-terminal domain protein (macronuclear) [Tetrahymena thermophila SB210]|uniref:ATP:guanido phosphotransferase, carboxy-terminal domain protein n=1 Tax=Tetrahymena thermophila (strain SB210) TaxID=312017 RepID=I7MFD0_TETTS|nr:ATP:guanido phosphotransferase, carboxy-terminal domain protein [Tetrahymena thermophila SB210]EAR99640.2 ATP:guanido phosphotransferase, carboxy-terminal domain protein [Tetrahymena thermophila SB210]|eukprot:XP_001019885.2 ATP:guanido phosphotransferase, carboxy-terminal domain protein [Tetrahymena thermophila SB210]